MAALVGTWSVPSTFGHSFVDTLQRGKRWVGQLARLGYFSIGAVYVLIAGLAILGIFGLGGQFTGAGGAARQVASWPFSRWMLGVIALGLALYVLWRLAQALLDVEGRGTDWRGLVRRAGLLLSGLSYAGLAVWVGTWVISGNVALHDPKEDWTARLMADPLGAVVAGVLGLGVIAVGLYQFYGAYAAGFMAFLGTDRIGAFGERALGVLGRIGLLVRGIVFVVLGGFVVVGAWQADPQEVKGLGEFFRMLGRQPYGYWLIGGVAAGLLAYGLFMIAKAGFRYVLPGKEEAPYRETEDAASADAETGDAEAPTARDAEHAEVAAR